MFHPTLSKTGRIFFYPLIKTTEFLGMHFPELLLRIRYFCTFKKVLNLKKPKDLNEKIIWAKLYSDTSMWSKLADKYLVREYVAKKGLEEHLVKLYAVWYNISDIDLSILPELFIVKANNGDGKGTNKIIQKKELIGTKKEDFIQMIDAWLRRKNIGALHAEPHYKDMIPCVVVEEVLPIENGMTSLTDYKIWCFNGKASYIWVCSNRNKNGNQAHVMTYDLNWNPHPEVSIFNSDYLEGAPIPKPKNLNKMISIAETLSHGFPEVRVDLYNVNGKIYFGELTFTSQGGFMDFYTPAFNVELGSKFNVDDFPKK